MTAGYPPLPPLEWKKGQCRFAKTTTIPATPMPASTVERETGDFAVVSAAEGESAGVPGARDSAPVVDMGEGPVVGSVGTVVPFREGVTVPAASVATVVGVAVTKGVEGNVTIPVTSVVVVTGMGRPIADTGAMRKHAARSRINGRASFTDTLLVIGDSWIPGDMRVMDPGNLRCLFKIPVNLTGNAEQQFFGSPVAPPCPQPSIVFRQVSAGARKQ